MYSKFDITDIVDDIHKICKIDKSERVDLNTIMNNLNIEHFVLDLNSIGNILSYVSVKSDRNIIVTNKHLHANVSRWYIAHSIGHLVLHSRDYEKDFKFIDILYNSRNPICIEAEIFAKELLIPEKQLRSNIDSLIVPMCSSLAEIFEVPVDKMKNRIFELNLKYIDL